MEDDNRTIDLQENGAEEIRMSLGKRIDMYENDWKEDLREYLRGQFHEKTFPHIAKMTDTTQNIFRRIVRQICTVYKESASREVGNNARWKELQEALRLDAVMMNAHRYSKAGTASFLLVRAVPGEDRLVVRILRPDVCHVVTNREDPTSMEAFAYRSKVLDAQGKKVDIWVYYSQARRLLLDLNGRLLKRDLGEGVEIEADNPYGMVPIVPVHAEEPVLSFWSPNWNRDAYEANLIIGALLTYENFLVKTQSFKQIVISADKVDEQVKGGILDPLFPLKLGSGATANTLDLNTHIDAVDKVIRGKVSAIANNYGISNENFTLTGSVASGFSLKVANQVLDDIRQADIPYFHDVEEALYRVIARVNNVEGLPHLPEDGKYEWNPGEVTFPEEWPVKQQRWSFEFQHGISNPVDYMLDQDPELSRDKAKQHLLTIAEENRVLNPKRVSLSSLLSRTPGGEAPNSGVPPEVRDNA